MLWMMRAMVFQLTLLHGFGIYLHIMPWTNIKVWSNDFVPRR
jgi:hypothetical protein